MMLMKLYAIMLLTLSQIICPPAKLRKLQTQSKTYNETQLLNSVMENVFSYWNNERSAMEYLVKLIVNPDGFISVDAKTKFEEKYINGAPYLVNIIINELSQDLRNSTSNLKNALKNIRKIVAEKIYTVPDYVMPILFEVKTKNITQYSENLNITDSDFKEFKDSWIKSNGDPFSNEQSLLSFVKDEYNYVYEKSGFKKTFVIFIIVGLLLFLAFIAVGIFLIFKFK